MHKGARDDPTLSFAKFRKFHFLSNTLYLAFFHLFVFTSIYNIILWADFAMCRVVLAVYLVYLSYFLTLFSLYIYYKK